MGTGNEIATNILKPCAITIQHKFSIHVFLLSANITIIPSELSSSVNQSLKLILKCKQEKKLTNIRKNIF